MGRERAARACRDAWGWKGLGVFWGAKQGKTPYISEEEENSEELWLLHKPSSPGLDGI